MEQDLFNQIKDSEYEMMDYYRINCINATGKYAPIKYILSPWHDAKSTYLYQLMGNELILEKEIMYKTPIAELTDRFHDLKWNNDSVFAKFVTELDRFIWNNRESLGDEYWKINRLTDSEVLAANSYSDDTFVVYSAVGRVIKVQTGSKPIKMLQKIIKSYPDNNVTSLQDFINLHSCVMNNATLKGTLCLSIHPLDYMTMSDNQHGWTSCMSWAEEGCYRLGTVEMMNSESVVVAYLKSNDGKVYEIGNNTWNSKKWRQLIIVDSDFICGIKCYPYRCDELTEIAIKWLMELGYVPSFCTACYREGRVGDRFMEICKEQKIHNFCHPNAIMTLEEYLEDYASPETRKVGEELIDKELKTLGNNKLKCAVEENLDKIKHGERDFRF